MRQANQRLAEQSAAADRRENAAPAERERWAGNGQEDKCSSRLSQMKVATGKVIGGKVVVEGAVLSEGASVTVLVRENDETFEVAPDEEAEILRALTEAARGEVVTSEQLLTRLRSRMA